jgi:hypothetical protein
MALSVATGKPWNGHRTKPGAVLYVCGEGFSGIRRRTKAWGLFHGLDLAQARFAMTRAAVPLTDPAAVAILILAVEEAKERLGGYPDLIFLDTLSRNFGAGDENSTQDMARFVHELSKLTAKWGCGALLVHHTGHVQQERARGSSVLKAALDYEYRIEKIDGAAGEAVLTNTKMKDADAPPPLRLRPVHVGIGILTEDGTEAHSLVLEPVDGAPGDLAHKSLSKTGWRGSKLNQAHQDMLSCLRRLYLRAQDNLSQAGRDPAEARVDMTTWREECAGLGICEDRRMFHQRRASLEKHGSIETDGVFVVLKNSASGES